MADAWKWLGMIPGVARGATRQNLLVALLFLLLGSLLVVAVLTLPGML